MKKLDKLILSSFLGPFFLTFLVVVFILLTQHMLKYFDDIVGKDLGWDILGQLLFYFAIFMTPIALPLAVLLSSLMTFGNLGEHFELTAIKSAGISLLRALLPIFGFVLLLTVFAFYSNNYFVPKAALEAYSLLWDIKQKKPALDLKQGAFYNGIPDFNIKVDKKHEDGKTIEDIIIYDHRGQTGNKKITLADSGAMYMINNERYLKLELFNGNFYFEDYTEAGGKPRAQETMSRSSFTRSEYVLDLSSFGMDRTNQSLFQGNRIMRNLNQLDDDVDSVNNRIMDTKVNAYNDSHFAFYYHLREDSIEMPSELVAFKEERDSLDEVRLLLKEQKEEEKQDSIQKLKVSTSVKKNKKSAKKSDAESSKALQRRKVAIAANNAKKNLKNGKLPKLDDTKKQRKVRRDNKPKYIYDTLSHLEIVEYLEKDSSDQLMNVIQTSLNNIRQTKSKIQSHNQSLERYVYEKNVFDIQYHKILANSIACIVMFLIGAPLGAIIKRGGLGMPVLMSIIFFIIFYVLSMTGEKWAKQDYLDPMWAIWSANLLLFPIGLFFLRQARNDARLFEADFYSVMIEKFNRWRKSGKLTTEENSN
ncbi:LptF/LptG family permease [Fulvivirga lutimaris]|uniref:LptF/LptG family permease n=1 Tax=Fulvivirga lutimaris TaxID=1819566 RepID=UPI0012BD6EA8|nr:LptF/LptG family permease [Fulvivirga lutimaris]MTI40799.1 YjgP/YjgQ family permease [Fulvivirga lutimaris]